MNRHTWGSALHGKKIKKRLQCAWVAGNKWKLNYVLKEQRSAILASSPIAMARVSSQEHYRDGNSGIVL